MKSGCWEMTKRSTALSSALSSRNRLKMIQASSQLLLLVMNLGFMDMTETKQQSSQWKTLNLL
jgi:hypothetical protein